MLTQASGKKETVAYAETIYQLLSGVEDPGTAVGRARASWGGSSSEFRSIVRAAGAFARDNDGYFIRYERDEKSKDPLSLPKATHLLVFPVPVEPRMRVAYSYVQGIFLKYLYAKYEAIPREVRQGWAEVICEGESSLPEVDELWADFLKSGVAEDTIEVSAKGWTSGSNIGKRGVDDAFLSESYLLGLARAIAEGPISFQWQAGDQIPAFRREDVRKLPEEQEHLRKLADREALGTSKEKDPEADKFRKQNRDKEWNTLQVYGWLEERSKEVPEFKQLVEEALATIKMGKSNQEITLLPAAARKLEEWFRGEFVPRSSRQDWTELAIPKITQYLLLWDLVNRLPEPKTGKITFLGWDLSYLRRMKESFNTPELRGSLKFMDKNDPKRGTRTLVKLTVFDKLEAEIRFLLERAEPSTSAPFELWSLAEPQPNGVGVESGNKVCTVCGKAGDLSDTGILPESKKRHYDNPQKNENADVCARCVQVWSLAPISTADDSYAIVEVPVENFLELFALYESLEGISRLETLKTLNRVSSLSVFPNKYLLLSRSTGKGKMPQTAQYHLQLARQPHFMERLGELDEDLEVIAAQDRAKLAREVALTLSVLQRLPYYHASKSEEKVPAMSIINALDRGRPYEALYVAAAQAHEAGRREAQIIVGGVGSYDAKVLQFGEFFARRQKGVDLSREIFRDVRTFSDYLDGILRPLVRREVEDSGSSVSGVARKYTENITKSFIRVNTADFLYRIASFTEAREREDLRKGLQDGGRLKGATRKRVRGANDQEVDPEAKEAKLELEQKLERYYEQYLDNKRDWKTFLEEVEARTLALLLLNVPNKPKRG